MDANRPRTWKRVLKSAARACAEGMLMIDPIAYAGYQRCNAQAHAQLAPEAGELVVITGMSCDLSGSLMASLIHDPVSKKLATSIVAERD